MKDNSLSSKSIYLKYTCWFSVLVLIIFSSFIFRGLTFVKSGDGFEQHLTSMIYYGRYLRILLTGSLPMWDFNIGEGADILQTLNYYVIGDPFALLSVFFSEKYMSIGFTIIILLKAYSTGLSFIYLCRYSKVRSTDGILAGALSYCFSFWVVYHCTKHPFFIGPMIYMPLVVVGVKKIVEENKPVLFTFAVAVSAFSNFYFFYMIVLCTVIYVVAYLISIYNNIMHWQKIAEKIGKILVYAILGTAMAAVLIIPTLSFFLSDSRTSGFTLKLFYPLKLYLKLPLMFFSPIEDFELFLGFSPVIFLSAISLIFSQDKNRLKFLVLISCLFCVVSVFGQIFNGFSYPAERWCWVFVLICCFLLADQWERIINIKTRIILLNFGLVLGYTIFFHIVFPKKFHVGISFFNAGLFFIIWFLFILLKKSKSRNVILFAIVIVSLVVNGKYHCYSLNGVMFSPEKIVSLLSNETKEIKELKDSSFYRFSGDRIEQNSNILGQLSSPSYYWSISNRNIVEFRKNLCSTKNGMLFSYCGYDSRAILETLACVKYYYTTDKGSIPYGFESTENDRIFKNKYALPLGYCYDKYIAIDKFKELSELKRQESMLQCVVLDNDMDSFRKSDIEKIKFNSSKIDYVMTPDENILVTDGKIIVRKENSCIKLAFSEISKSEVYLILRGFGYSGNFYYHPHSVGLEIAKNNGRIINFKYFLPDDDWYAENHDFILNLGYAEKSDNELTITFDKKGTYSFDSIELSCQTFVDYPDQIAKLKKNSLENVKFGINQVSGNIKLQEKKALLLSIPYSKGWRAEVDGEPAVLLRANIMNMALLLEPGEHSISLHYCTPFLKIGALISAFAWIIFILICFRSIRKRKRV